MSGFSTAVAGQQVAHLLPALPFANCHLPCTVHKCVLYTSVPNAFPSDWSSALVSTCTNDPLKHRVHHFRLCTRIAGRPNPVLPRQRLQPPGSLCVSPGWGGQQVLHRCVINASRHGCSALGATYSTLLRVYSIRLTSARHSSKLCTVRMRDSAAGRQCVRVQHKQRRGARPLAGMRVGCVQSVQDTPTHLLRSNRRPVCAL